MLMIVLAVPGELEVMVRALRDGVETAMTQAKRARLDEGVAYGFEQEFRERVDCASSREMHTRLH